MASIKANLLSKFTQNVDFEIKKIYRAFISKEKELYVDINSHLHIRNNYIDFSCSNLINELNELIKISQFALKLENFVNLNLVALRKILKKFDKKLSFFFGNIASSYISKKLEGNNSDLLYLLQFKMIDEASAVIDDLLEDVKARFIIAFRNLKNINTTSELKSSLNDNDFELDNLSKNQVKELFYKLINALESNLIHLDEHSQSFKTMFGDWNNILRKRINFFSYLKPRKESINYLIFTQYDENVIDYDRIKDSYKPHISTINTSNTNKKKRSRSSSYTSLSYVSENSISESDDNIDPVESKFSKKQKINIAFTYLNLFISVLSTFSIYPSIGSYIEKRVYSGFELINIAWILTLNTFGFLIGSLIFPYIKCFNYRRSMIFSFFLISLGNLIYCFNNLTCLIIGRVIIGLASCRVAGKNYLIDYLPERYQGKYLEYYQYLAFTSIMISFLFSGFCSLFNNDNLLSSSIMISSETLSSFILCLISFIFTIIAILLYSEPTNDSFTIFKETSSIIDSPKNLTFANINEKILSKQELEMIDEIDSKLSNYNNESKFTDTNLVQKTINLIVLKEKKHIGFIKKNYLILITCLIITKTILESSLILAPLIVWFNKKEQNMIAYMLFLCLLRCSL